MSQIAEMPKKRHHGPLHQIVINRLAGLHWRQEPFLVTHKTYTKPSTFVKYVIKLVGVANPIADSKFVEEYIRDEQ